MAQIRLREPNYWRLSSDTGLRRGFVQQVYDLDKLEIAENSRHTYDEDWIFYSIAYCRARGMIYAIGPDLVDLKSHVLPMKAEYSTDGGETYSSARPEVMARYYALNMTIVTMDVGVIDVEQIALRLRLASGEEKQFTLENAPSGGGSISVNTLQKNNEPSWIADWINYYRSVGIRHFSIYDNGSDNLDAVLQTIARETDEDITVELTVWPFPYGVHGIHNTLFAQPVSITDFLYRHQEFEWLINCDIDEYVIFDEGETEFIANLEAMPDDVGCLQIGCSDAWLLSGLEYPEEISARDLVWRSRKITNKFKNIFRADAVVTASTHFLRLRQPFRCVHPDETGLTYLHARPLNSGWHSAGRRKERVRFLEERFVEDHRVAQRLARIKTLQPTKRRKKGAHSDEH